MSLLSISQGTHTTWTSVPHVTHTVREEQKNNASSEIMWFIKQEDV